MSPFRASVPLTEDWQHFRFAVADGVATVTLDRPEKLNPLTFESYADLRDLLAELPHRGDTRVLVIRGEGRAFCAGGDVNEIIGELTDGAGRADRLHPDDRRRDPGDARVPGPDHRGDPGHRRRRRRGDRAGLRLPGVHAVGAGSRSCSPRSGCPAATWARRTCCRGWSGSGRATQLLMLGDTIDAETADRYGLVSQLVGDDDLDDAVGRAGPAARRRADAGLRADQGADHPRAGHGLSGGDGARRDDPGAADDQRRPRGVPRRVQRAPAAAVDRPLRICSRRMSAWPQCCANSRRACR